MRVLHLVPLVSSGAAYGGPVRGTLRQAEFARALGASIDVMSLWSERGPIPGALMGQRVRLFKGRNVPIHHIGGGWSFGALWWLARRVKSFDVVHLHAGRDLWVLVGALICRVANTPYVWQTHGMLNVRRRFRVKVYDWLLTRPALRGAAAMLYLTPFEERKLKEFGIPLRAELVLNGVDPAAKRFEVRADRPLQVIFLSRLHRRKNADWLVLAAASMRRKGLRVCVDIFGPDEGAADVVRGRIASEGAQDFVRYAGAIGYDRVRETLALYDVFALPSVDEPFPNALLEALSAGLPSICTSSCGLAPYVEAAGAAIVIEPTVEALEAALTALATSVESRQRLSVNAAALASSTFGMGAIAKRLVELYESVVDPVNKPASLA